MHRSYNSFYSTVSICVCTYEFPCQSYVPQGEVGPKGDIGYDGTDGIPGDPGLQGNRVSCHHPPFSAGCYGPSLWNPPPHLIIFRVPQVQLAPLVHLAIWEKKEKW